MFLLVDVLPVLLGEECQQQNEKAAKDDVGVLLTMKTDGEMLMLMLMLLLTLQLADEANKVGVTKRECCSTKVKSTAAAIGMGDWKTMLGMVAGTGQRDVGMVWQDALGWCGQ
ncbi:hypothetical protein Ddye_026228 [Dipteronia dyeriana]|uniref:Uncharacterized protein n=1 Tax=Dipteronia dyeriana TaxID=168575 RepID=A0AAD9WQA6_9ROSI|nr:hypothetical protein Ddye_026228 [Dipteronia dyeriana]